MDNYKIRLACTLAETGALFFDDGLVLKDGRTPPYFVNMAMFKTGRLALEMGSIFAEMMVLRGITEKTDILLGPSYKGSAIALATAMILWKDHGCDLFFEYDRKEAKTHGEASRTGNLFVNSTFFDGCRIFIVDDVATSMKTKVELLEKIGTEAGGKGMNLQVIGIGIAIDREQTTAVYDEAGRAVEGARGQNAIEEFSLTSGIPVYSVAGIREVVTYLYEQGIPVLVGGVRRPISAGVKEQFDRYLRTYGVNKDKV
jgi:orotate phosphoribosyltransferase